MALALLAGCELARPEGAYFEREAMVPEAGLIETVRTDAGPVLPPPVPGGVQSGTQGGGMQGGMPGTSGGTAGGMAGDMGGVIDAGPPVLTAEQQALKSLEGRYFMRMDMMSTTTIQSALARLTTVNRISHLIATQLVYDNGQLKGSERLCYQTFEHRCMSGCTSLTTRMAASMTDWFVKMEYTQRNYVLSNGMLSGMTNTMALGYDAKTNPQLPTIEDARVWDPVPGAKREGLLLGLQLTGLRNVTCDVYTTQSFVSKFGPARLGGTPTMPTLEAGSSGLKFALDTEGSDGATLDATDANCKDSGSAAPSNDGGEQYVRFARVGPSEFGGEGNTAFWGCPPQSEWDSRLRPPSL